MNTQRLYRSRTNKVFAGVCGGLAEYFDVDPVVIRILFVLMVLFGGSGVLLYIAAIIIVPQKPYNPADYEQTATPSQAATPSNARNWFGYALIIFGGLLLLANLDVFHFFDFFGNAIEYIFPILLIILGMAIIYYKQSNLNGEKTNGGSTETSAGGQAYQQSNTGFRQFRRSYTDKKLAGVCGGMANYFGIDPSIIRMLYVILCLASFGAGLVLYLVLALAVPYDNVVKPEYHHG